MKTRFLFFIPFFISNCHKISQDTQRDNTKVGLVKNTIKKNYNSAQQRLEYSEKIDVLDFKTDILNFGNNDSLSDVISDFSIFYPENKRYFEFLCNCDFSKETTVKNKFKTLVEDFVNSDNADDKVYILGQLVFLFEKLDFEKLDIDFDKIFNDKSLKENIVANVLNFVASVYCLKNHKCLFLKEIQNENFRQSFINHDILVAKNKGLKGSKVSVFNSYYLNDSKLIAVRKFSGNAPLCRFFDNNDITNKHIFNENDTNINQIINLTANIEHFANDPKFNFGDKLVKILSVSQEKPIDKETKCDNVLILDCICDICKKIATRTPEQHLNAESFSVLTSSLKDGIIDSSDMWQVFIDACNTDLKTNTIIDKNYSSHIVDLFDNEFVLPNDLAVKTFNLMPDQSLTVDKFIKILNKIHEPKKIFDTKENSENLFRLLDCSSLNEQNFTKIQNEVCTKNDYKFVFVNRTTFECLIKQLKKLNIWTKDNNKNKFIVDKTACSGLFYLQCSEDEKQKIKNDFGL